MERMKNETLRERVARAIYYSQHGEDEDWKFYCRNTPVFADQLRLDADAVLAALELDGVPYLTGPDYSEAVKRAAVAIADTIGDPINHPFYAECFIKGLSAFFATEERSDVE